MNRRAFIAGIALATVPPAASVAMTAHPDAELLALGKELEAAWLLEVAEDNRIISEADAGLISDEECDRLMEASPYPDPALIERIAALQAHTIEGLHVHALAQAWCYGGALALAFEDCDHREERLAWQMTRTLAALGRAS